MRRAKGDGGLYQRHDHPTCPPRIDGYRTEHRCRGRWVGTVEVKRPDGTAGKKYVYGRTQAEAKKKLDAANRAKADGTLVLSSLTMGQWLDHWWDHIAAPTLKPQTRRGYDGYVRKWIRPTLGNLRLDAIRPDHIRGLHERMRTAGSSPATVKQAHAIVRKVLAEAVYDGKLAVNPAERVKTPSAEKNHRAGLTKEQALSVLSSTDDARWWLAVFYGMRQGECLGLRWSDVDLDAGVLTIAQTLQVEAGGVLSFGTPKSKTSRRTIPLAPVILARLKVARAADDAIAPDALVFRSGNGDPIRPDEDRAAWKALLSSLDLPVVALHAARNTAASLMEAAGIPDRMVAQILGHSQVQITHGYQSAELARMRVAVESLAALVARGRADDAVPPEPPALPAREPGGS